MLPNRGNRVNRVLPTLTKHANQTAAKAYYAYAWALAGILCFSLTFPITKLILTDFDPLFIALARSAIAGIVSLILLWRAKAKRPNAWQIAVLLIMSAGVILGFPILSSLAMQSTTVTHAGIVGALLPLATAIIGTWLSKERQGKRFWLCAISASSLVLAYSASSSEMVFTRGDIYLFLSIPLGAMGYAFGGHLAKSLPPWQVICWALVLSSPITVPLSFYYMPTSLITVNTNSWLGLLYLALVSQLLGFFFWNKGLAEGGIAKISQLQLLQPFTTLTAGYILVGETLQFYHFVVCGVVIILVYLGRSNDIALFKRKLLRYVFFLKRPHRNKCS